MSTQPSRTSARPKEQLLERAVDHLTARGMSDVSLRQLASALGTSHRMLIYHFGSKQGLFVEVIRATELRQRQALADLIDEPGADLSDTARRFWRRLRSPERAGLERLFFEVYGQALQGRAYAVPLLDGVVDSWIESVVPALTAEGLSHDEARAEARLGLAVIRGLLLDVLATGDEAGVEEAFERYLSAR